MHDSTTLLTTIAQLSGGFVAIISGFVISKVLASASSKAQLNREYQKENVKVLEKMEERGITAHAIVQGKHNDELREIRKGLNEIVWQIQLLDDSTYLIRAFIALVPIIILGIIVPISFMALNKTVMSVRLQVIICGGFIASLLFTFGFIGWYAWRVHSEI